MFRRGLVSSARMMIAALVSMVALLTLGQIAMAHGKEVDVYVSTLTPDHNRPLLKLFRVNAHYAGDQETIDNATVEVSATRDEDGISVDPIELSPLSASPGIYAGEVEFPRFGTWHVKVAVSEPLGVGSGSAIYDLEVSPGNLSDAEAAAMEAEAERVQRLQVLFGFEPWPDVVNILVRILHTASSGLFFGIVLFAIGVGWFGSAGKAVRLWDTMRPRMGLLLAMGLAGMLATGAYSSVFDAPITTPGIYNYRRMFEIPYGEVYMAAYAAKLIGWVGLALLAGMTSSFSVSEPELEGDERVAATKDLTYFCVGAIVVAAADLAVLIYMHYLSHLAVFLPN